MNTRFCSACKTEIVFLRKPRKDGTVGHHPTDAVTVQAGDEVFDPERHVSHFDTCPEAWRFRPARPAPAAKAAARTSRAPAREPVQMSMFGTGGGT